MSTATSTAVSSKLPESGAAERPLSAAPTGESRYSTVSFLSDYGLQDEFVGVVKSVLHSIVPTVHVVDVTHGIKSHDVRAGGLALARAAEYLNPGVVLAVVDPGVATERRGVAVEVGDGASILVGPDNGLLAPAVAMVGGATRAVDITNSPFRLDAPGATFDGRDLFAPVAAHLCLGASLDDVGTEINPALLMPAVVPVCAREGDQLAVEVLWIDRFGNVQLNVGPEDLLDLSPDLALQINDRSWPLHQASAYDSIRSGEIGLITDSSGLLSLCVQRGSAADELRVLEGDSLRLIPSDGASAPTPIQLTRRPS